MKWRIGMRQKDVSKTELPRRHSHLQCKAKSKRSRQRCKSPAIPGLQVCWKHGGATGRSQAAAKKRVADLIDPDKVLRAAAARAFTDPADFYDDNGQPKPLSQIPKEARMALGMIKTMLYNPVSGDGVQSTVAEYRFHDATKNLEMLFKYLNMFEKKITVTHKEAYQWGDEK